LLFWNPSSPIWNGVIFLSIQFRRFAPQEAQKIVPIPAFSETACF
jgi:hypothetical protein